MIYGNIFYFRVINKIGGTEQFLYEIAKKYNKIDITIFYDQADLFQLKRLSKYVRCKKRVAGEKVLCKRAFFNFNIDMIEDVESIENYYAFVSHANWTELGYKPPIEHPKLNHFIGVSQFASEMLDKYGKELGINTNTTKCYNPLSLEPKEKVIEIVTACRLEDKTKGGDRTKILIEALDRYCNKTGRHYLLYIFSNSVHIPINSPNVILMKPRVDVRPFIQKADYVCQLSNDMETYCYTINEALGYGVPVITTPLSILKELPITDNEHIVLDWDCSNVDEVVRQIFEKEVKEFEYKIPKDSWNKLLSQDKSTYKAEQETIVKVQCINEYTDLQLNKKIKTTDKPFKVDKFRAEELVKAKVCKILND